MLVPVVPCKAIEIGEARRAVVIVEALTLENYAYFTDLECTKETMQPATAGKAHLGRVAEGAASEAASSARSINSMRCEPKESGHDAVCVEKEPRRNNASGIQAPSGSQAPRLAGEDEGEASQ